MPLNSRVAVPEGGKFAGMRMIVVSMPRASSTSQNGCPCRRSSTLPPEIGNCHSPTVIARLEPSARDVDRYGTIVFGSRWMKSKMPWPPGSRPVMNVDHATGLCGGIVVSNGAKPPDAARRAKFGSRPLSMSDRVRS